MQKLKDFLQSEGYDPDNPQPAMKAIAHELEKVLDSGASDPERKKRRFVHFECFCLLTSLAHTASAHLKCSIVYWSEQESSSKRSGRGLTCFGMSVNVH